MFCRSIYFIGLINLLFCTTSYSDEGLILKKNNKVIDVYDMREVGKAKFSVLFWDIYQSRLLSPSGRFEKTKKNYIFEITYLRDISKNDLLARTVEQWQHLSFDKEQYQGYITKLEDLWPNIKAGNSLSLWVKPNTSEFYFNNQYIGAIDDDSFGELFLAIWLSPETSQPKLRQQLLGETS